MKTVHIKKFDTGNRPIAITWCLERIVVNWKDATRLCSGVEAAIVIIMREPGSVCPKCLDNIKNILDAHIAINSGGAILLREEENEE